MKTTATILAITICLLDVAMSAEKAFMPRFSDAPSVEATRLHLNVVGAYRLVSDKTKFHLNNMTSLAASLPSGSSGNFEIYGDYPSSSMFDAELSLETVEGTTLCTTNITVLWVDISMRCGQDDPFSADKGMEAYPASISGSKLGMQRHYGFILPSRPFNSPTGRDTASAFAGRGHGKALHCRFGGRQGDPPCR